jgi:hypothetical protein
VSFSTQETAPCRSLSKAYNGFESSFVCFDPISEVVSQRSAALNAPLEIEIRTQLEKPIAGENPTPGVRPTPKETESPCRVQ